MAKKKKRACHAKNLQGKPCGAVPLKPGTVIEGVTVTGKWCRQHDKDLPDKARIGGEQPGAGRPPKPKPTEVMRQLVENHVQVVMAPHFRTLGYDVIRNEETGQLELVELPEGGAKLHGTSARSGRIQVSEHDDLGAHIAAAERLLDRVYGRPKQATEITGADGGPVTFADLAAAAGGGD